MVHHYTATTPSLTALGPACGHPCNAPAGEAVSSAVTGTNDFAESVAHAGRRGSVGGSGVPTPNLNRYRHQNEGPAIAQWGRVLIGAGRTVRGDASEAQGARAIAGVSAGSGQAPALHNPNVRTIESRTYGSVADATWRGSSAPAPQIAPVTAWAGTVTRTDIGASPARTGAVWASNPSHGSVHPVRLRDAGTGSDLRKTSCHTTTKSSCRAARQKPQVRCAARRDEGTVPPGWYRPGRITPGERRPSLSSSICGGPSYIGVNGSEDTDVVPTGRVGARQRRVPSWTKGAPLPVAVSAEESSALQIASGGASWRRPVQSITPTVFHTGRYLRNSSWDGKPRTERLHPVGSEFRSERNGGSFDPLTMKSPAANPVYHAPSRAMIRPTSSQGSGLYTWTAVKSPSVRVGTEAAGPLLCDSPSRVRKSARDNASSARQNTGETTDEQA